jgi:hypothetical protein
MANLDALRGALEEDPFLGGGPVGVPEADPTMVDYGDTTMARASGLRARPPVASDWREKEAERIARERLDAERLTPSPEMLSRVAERSRDSGLKLNSGIASPIPFASAPVKADVPAAVAGTIAPTTSTSSAPPAGTSSTVKPPPVDAGSGGDDELGRLSMGQALVRALEGSGSVISGQNLRSGAADTLGERMKQIEALRAKKAQVEEDRALEAKTWGVSNRAALASALSQWKGDPEKTAALEALASGVDTTKQSDFAKSLFNAVMTKPKVLGAEATAKKTGAQTTTEEGKPEIARGTLEVKRGKLAEDIRKNKAAEAIRWAAMNRAAQNAATKLTTGQPETVQKEVRATTQKLGDSVAKEYGEISSALKEADRSLVAIKNQPPDVFAKVMH